MEEFRSHYYTVMFIGTSMIYAFLMKLLFKFCQKTREELQKEGNSDKRPYKLPIDAW